MLKMSKKLVLSLSTIIIISGIIAGTLTFADPKKPSRGSISFGSPEKPQIKSTPQLESFKNVFGDIAEKVVPTVVAIQITKIDTITYYQNPFFRFFEDGDGGEFPFDHFFFGPQTQPRQRQKGQGPSTKPQIQRRTGGVGSGVIVSKDGYVLTNFHVVNGADEIEVKLSDMRTFKAKIIGSDSLSDIAVIKMEGDNKNLPVAYIGNSDKLRVGDWIMAVGTPFNLSSTVTAGIVSALGRALDQGMVSSNKNMYQNFIQTDAAINPGNSGGALVNLDGELVGINTMIFSTSGGFMGIGFAVPISLARKVMEDIIYEGKVTRGWLGISIQDLDADTRSALNLGDARGVLIGDVFKGQPADKAGIKRGDIIISVAGVATGSANQLRNAVAAIRPGEKVPVVIMRNGKQMTLQAVITERSDKLVLSRDSKGQVQPDNDAAPVGALGLSVGPLTPEIRSQLRLDPNTAGVIITGVEENSIAAQRGIQPNDIITQVNQQAITSVKDYTQAVKQLKKDQSVLFLIQREGNTFFVAFRLPK